MRKLILINLMLLSLLACSRLHIREVKIQQGNVITSKMVKQLHNGMSKRQVATRLGTTVLNTTFNENRWDYVYFYHDNDNPTIKQRLTLYFQNNRLAKITSQGIDLGLLPKV